MKYSRACLVAILAIIAVVTTGSNYRLMGTLVGAGQWPAPNSLLAAPAGAATVSVGDLAVGSVISVGGMNYVKINSNNVLAAASNFACPDGQWIAGKYVRCYDKNWDGLTIAATDVQVYGCQSPTGLMQTWDGCSGLATPSPASGSTTNTDYYTQGPCLIDARDGKTYEVRKYADGKCWMVDNLAYGGDTLWGGKDGCVAHPHMGVSFGSYSSATDFFQSDGTSINYLDYEWENGVGKVDNFGTGRVLRGTFGNWDAAGNLTTDSSKITTYSYGNCAQAYDGATYKAYEVFGTDGYTRSTTEYDTYAAALAATGDNPDLVRPRGYHYEWLAATQNPTGYHGGIYDATQGPSSGICPDGWRLPTGGTTSAEWRKLFVAVGGAATGNGGANSESHAVARQYLLSRWKAPTSGRSLSDNSGLLNLTTYGYWWSSTVLSATHAYYMAFYEDTVNPEATDYKDYGRSVRCVKD